MSRVIVIGAGAVGLSAAFHLGRDGHDVTVVDPAPLAAKASGHNAGWVIPSMSTPVPAPGMLGQAARWLLRPDGPLYVAPSLDPGLALFLARMLRHTTREAFARGTRTLGVLAGGALAAFDELVAAGVEFEMHDDPLTMLFTDPHKVEVRVAELEELDGTLPGFSWRHLEAGELASGLPPLAPGVVAGIESRGDRSLAPASFVRGLADACRRDGVELRLGEAAALVDGGARTGVRVGGVVERPDRVVVAAGVWTDPVLAGVREHVGVRAGKGYGYDVPRVPGDPLNLLYLAEAKVAVTPLDAGVRVAGTMGFGGIDESVDERRARGILAGLGDYLEGWPPDPETLRPWVGLRPMTADGVPVVGPLRSRPEVLVATGHAMLGVGLGPVTGALVADLVAGRRDPASIPGLLPGR